MYTLKEFREKFSRMINNNDPFTAKCVNDIMDMVENGVSRKTMALAVLDDITITDEDGWKQLDIIEKLIPYTHRNINYIRNVCKTVYDKRNIKYHKLIKSIMRKLAEKFMSDDATKEDMEQFAIDVVMACHLSGTGMSYEDAMYPVSCFVDVADDTDMKKAWGNIKNLIYFNGLIVDNMVENSNDEDTSMKLTALCESYANTFEN